MENGAAALALEQEAICVPGLVAVLIAGALLCEQLVDLTLGHQLFQLPVYGAQPHRLTVLPQPLRQLDSRSPAAGAGGDALQYRRLLLGHIGHGNTPQI